MGDTSPILISGRRPAIRLSSSTACRWHDGQRMKHDGCPAARYLLTIIDVPAGASIMNNVAHAASSARCRFLWLTSIHYDIDSGQSSPTQPCCLFPCQSLANRSPFYRREMAISDSGRALSEMISWAELIGALYNIWRRVPPAMTLIGAMTRFADNESIQRHNISSSQ